MSATELRKDFMDFLQDVIDELGPECPMQPGACGVHHSPCSVCLAKKLLAKWKKREENDA